MTAVDDGRLYRKTGAALVRAMAAAEADDLDAQALAITAAARALHEWAIAVRARMPTPQTARKPPTLEERLAKRRRDFPEIGTKGPKAKK